VIRRDFFNNFVFEHILDILLILQCISSLPNGAISNWQYLLVKTVPYQFILSIQGMQLNLIYCRLNFAVTQEIPQTLDIEVGDANASNQAFFY